jgi:hypothetical protein
VTIAVGATDVADATGKDFSHALSMEREAFITPPLLSFLRSKAASAAPPP